MHPHFVKVASLPRQKTTQPTLKITVKENLRSEKDQLLEATASHTFLRCTDTSLVKASDLKVGDCLLTAVGPKLVAKVEPIPEDEAVKSETYSVITEGGAKDIISVGGVLARATDHSHLSMLSTAAATAVTETMATTETMETRV